MSPVSRSVGIIHLYQLRGFMGALMVGVSCSTGTAGSVKEACDSGPLVASFLQHKRLSDSFHGFRNRRASAIGSPQTHVGESSSTCLLSTPHHVTSKSSRSAKASGSLAYRRQT